MQAGNFVLPLLTLPYLARTLGADYFGQLAFAAALMSYFMILVDFGFNLSATNQISIQRNNQSSVNKIFNAVLAAKIILFIVSIVVLLILLELFPDAFHDRALFIYTHLQLAGNVVFPVWFFQGIEKMKFVAYITFISRIIFTVGIFIFVSNPSHYIYVPIITAVGSAFSGVCATYIATRYFNIDLQFPRIRDIREVVSDASYLFFSNVASSIYTNSVVFVLGLFTTPAVVGYFSAAQKILQAVRSVYSPIAQALFPMAAKTLAKSGAEGFLLVKTISSYVVPMFGIFSIVLFVFSSSLIYWMFGPDFTPAAELLRYMAFVPLLVVLSNVLGTQIMLNWNMKKRFMYIILSAAMLGVPLILGLVANFGAIGACFSVLAIESYVTVLMAYSVYRKLRHDKYCV